MKTIKITVKSGEEAQLIMEMMKKLSFVTSIDSFEEKSTPKVPKGNFSSETEFLALSGIWSGRDISSEKIREQAWRKIKL